MKVSADEGRRPGAVGAFFNAAIVASLTRQNL